jgi:hypothetical protein
MLMHTLPFIDDSSAAHGYASGHLAAGRGGAGGAEGRGDGIFDDDFLDDDNVGDGAATASAIHNPRWSWSTDLFRATSRTVRSCVRVRA